MPSKDECRELVHQIFGQLAQEAGPVYKDILRYFLLEELDRCWKEHLRNMDALRDGIGLRGYGQRDPKLEYKREGFHMFEMLMLLIHESAIKALTRVHVQPRPEEGVAEAMTGQGGGSDEPAPEAPAAMPASESEPEASAEDIPEEFRHRDSTQNLSYSGASEAEAVAEPAKPEPARAAPRVGRNDPCPCGSGKKYKKCCGKGK